MTNIDDTYLIDLNLLVDERGTLCPIEFKSLPIDIKRIFYVFGVDSKNSTRGNHAHITTNQILICISGSCKVICKDGISKISYTLDNPSKALFIPNMIWDNIIYESRDTILLALSDTEYNRDDYIENWNEYIKSKKRA